MSEIVEIFTDGACRGNPGPGGWGAIIRFGKNEKQISGSASETTNNRMELTAAIRALEALNRQCKVKLTTDSEYVKKGIVEWLPGWKKRGWKTAAKKAVKNIDLWKALEQVAAPHDVKWCWVRGHSGHPENELVDQLANQAIDNMLNGH